jgi:hypothetical protein
MTTTKAGRRDFKKSATATAAALLAAQAGWTPEHGTGEFRALNTLDGYKAKSMGKPVKK